MDHDAKIALRLFEGNAITVNQMREMVGKEPLSEYGDCYADGSAAKKRRFARVRAILGLGR